MRLNRPGFSFLVPVFQFFFSGTYFFWLICLCKKYSASNSPGLICFEARLSKILQKCSFFDKIAIFLHDAARNPTNPSLIQNRICKLLWAEKDSNTILVFVIFSRNQYSYLLFFISKYWCVASDWKCNCKDSEESPYSLAVKMKKYQ